MNPVIYPKAASYKTNPTLPTAKTCTAGGHMHICIDNCSCDMHVKVHAYHSISVSRSVGFARCHRWGGRLGSENETLQLNININLGSPTWTSMSVYQRSTSILATQHGHRWAFTDGRHRSSLLDIYMDIETHTDIDIDTDLQFCPHPRSIIYHVVRNLPGSILLAGIIPGRSEPQNMDP